MQQRHRPSGTAPEEILGWGTFGAVLAAVLVALTGSGWVRSLLILVLGLGATGLLWLAGRFAGRSARAGERSAAQRRRHSGRHQ